VPAVYAVKDADRDDAMAPPGGYRVESSPALHVGQPTDALSLPRSS
jgi:hypothetical protein